MSGLGRVLLFCCIATSLFAREQTVITSIRMEMQGTEDRNYFYFTGDVIVKGTNLNISCEELTVVSSRKTAGGEVIGEIGSIDSIVAQGNVVIHQAGRSAYAGRAEVDPVVGTVVLKENPRILDGEVEVSGYQFVLHKGEKKFESIPDPNAGPAGGRSKVSLGALPDLGFDQEPEEISLGGSSDENSPSNASSEEISDNPEEESQPGE